MRLIFRSTSLNALLPGSGGASATPALPGSVISRYERAQCADEPAAEDLSQDSASYPARPRQGGGRGITWPGATGRTPSRPRRSHSARKSDSGLVKTP